MKRRRGLVVVAFEWGTTSFLAFALSVVAQ